MNQERPTSAFLHVITLLALASLMGVFVVAYIDAADCPTGQVAVRNIWNWPVCIAGAQP